MRKIIIASLLTSLLLCLLGGCGSVPEEPHYEKETWKEMPQLIYGLLESEKLSSLPWYSGRAEATGFGMLAETESGWYLVLDGRLTYADKENAESWLPVCPDPSCGHTNADATCSSDIGWNDFYLKDGRIYFADDTDDYLELCGGKEGTVAIFSRAANGLDIRLEYILEEAREYPGFRAMASAYISEEHLIYERINVDNAGVYHAVCYRVTGENAEILLDKAIAEPVLYLAGSSSILGDHGYFSTLQCGGEMDLIVSVNGELKIRDTSGYYNTGKYLSGNILRIFRPGDGYYDVNLETGEEVWIAENQLSGSDATILLPNCIIETTLVKFLENKKAPDEKHAMRLFDGERWNTVILPEVLLNANNFAYAAPIAVTSDRIIFRVSEDGQNSRIYCIMLGQEEYTLQYCGRLVR